MRVSGQAGDRGWPKDNRNYHRNMENTIDKNDNAGSSAKNDSHGDT